MSKYEEAFWWAKRNLKSLQRKAGSDRGELCVPISTQILEKFAGKITYNEAVNIANSVCLLAHIERK